MFLKLSAKLYTSVFHHGLKVGELQQGTGDRVDPAEARKENCSPQLTGRSQHPLPEATPPLPSQFPLSSTPPSDSCKRKTDLKAWEVEVGAGGGGQGVAAVSPQGERFPNLHF